MDKSEFDKLGGRLALGRVLDQYYGVNYNRWCFIHNGMYVQIIVTLDEPLRDWFSELSSMITASTLPVVAEQCRSLIPLAGEADIEASIGGYELELSTSARMAFEDSNELVIGILRAIFAAIGPMVDQIEADANEAT
jgi:hypothetical protein